MQGIITNGLNVSQSIRNWNRPVGVMSCERNLLPLGDRSPLWSDYAMNIKEFPHTQHSFTSKWKVSAHNCVVSFMGSGI